MEIGKLIRSCGPGILLLCLVALLAGCKPEAARPEEVMNAFAQAWQLGNYAVMYQSLTQSAMQKVTEDAFVARHQSIYKGIDAVELQVKAVPLEKKPV